MARSTVLAAPLLVLFLGCGTSPVTASHSEPTVPWSAEAPRVPSMSSTASRSAASSSAEQQKRCAELHAKPYPELTAEPTRIAPPTTASASLPQVPAPASSSEAGLSGGGVSKVVASLAPSFRRCYSDGLRCDKDMTGGVRLEGRIAADGTVSSTRIVKSKGLSRGVIDCVAVALKSARFGEPEGGGATIVVPVSFVLPPDSATP